MRVGLSLNMDGMVLKVLVSGWISNRNIDAFLGTVCDAFGFFVDSRHPPLNVVPQWVDQSGPLSRAFDVPLLSNLHQFNVKTIQGG